MECEGYDRFEESVRHTAASLGGSTHGQRQKEVLVRAHRKTAGMLREAGLERVDVRGLPEDPFNNYYIAQTRARPQESGESSTTLQCTLPSASSMRTLMRTFSPVLSSARHSNVLPTWIPR
jgi:hypothetical protein